MSENYLNENSNGKQNEAGACKNHFDDGINNYKTYNKQQK